MYIHNLPIGAPRIALALAVFFSFAIPYAFASGSSGGYKVDFDSLTTRTTEGSGEAYKVIGGTTHIQANGAGTSYKITPTAYISPEETVAQTVTQEAESTSVNGGSRGGTQSMSRKITAAQREYLIRVGVLSENPESTEEAQAKSEDEQVINLFRDRLFAVVDGQRVVYRDVPSDAWYTPFVAYVVSNGIAHGYETPQGRLSGEFRAGNPITKAEALKMAMHATNNKPQVNANPEDGKTSSWAHPYLSKALDLNLSQYNSGFRDANEPASRISVLKTLLELAGIPIAKKPSGFADVPSNSPDSSVVATAEFYGIVSGFPDGSFKPKETMTRSSASKVMALINKVLGNEMAGAQNNNQ